MTEIQLEAALLAGACRGIGKRVAALRETTGGDAAAQVMRLRFADAFETCAVEVGSAAFAALVHDSLRQDDTLQLAPPAAQEAA